MNRLPFEPGRPDSVLDLNQPLNQTGLLVRLLPNARCPSSDRPTSTPPPPAAAPPPPRLRRQLRTAAPPPPAPHRRPTPNQRPTAMVPSSHRHFRHSRPTAAACSLLAAAALHAPPQLPPAAPKAAGQPPPALVSSAHSLHAASARAVSGRAASLTPASTILSASRRHPDSPPATAGRPRRPAWFRSNGRIEEERGLLWLIGEEEARTAQIPPSPDQRPDQVRT